MLAGAQDAAAGEVGVSHPHPGRRVGIERVEHPAPVELPVSGVRDGGLQLCRGGVQGAVHPGGEGQGARGARGDVAQLQQGRPALQRPGVGQVEAHIFGAAGAQVLVAHRVRDGLPVHQGGRRAGGQGRIGVAVLVGVQREAGGERLVQIAFQVAEGQAGRLCAEAHLQVAAGELSRVRALAQGEGIPVRLLGEREAVRSPVAGLGRRAERAPAVQRVLVRRGGVQLQVRIGSQQGHQVERRVLGVVDLELLEGEPHRRGAECAFRRGQQAESGGGRRVGERLHPPAAPVPAPEDGRVLVHDMHQVVGFQLPPVFGGQLHDVIGGGQVQGLHGPAGRARIQVNIQVFLLQVLEALPGQRQVGGVPGDVEALDGVVLRVQAVQGIVRPDLGGAAAEPAEPALEILVQDLVADQVRRDRGIHGDRAGSLPADIAVAVAEAQVGVVGAGIFGDLLHMASGGRVPFQPAPTFRRGRGGGPAGVISRHPAAVLAPGPGEGQRGVLAADEVAGQDLPAPFQPQGDRDRLRRGDVNPHRLRNGSPLVQQVGHPGLHGKTDRMGGGDREGVAPVIPVHPRRAVAPLISLHHDGMPAGRIRGGTLQHDFVQAHVRAGQNRAADLDLRGLVGHVDRDGVGAFLVPSGCIVHRGRQPVRAGVVRSPEVALHALGQGVIQVFFVDLPAVGLQPVAAQALGGAQGGGDGHHLPELDDCALGGREQIGLFEGGGDLDLYRGCHHSAAPVVRLVGEPVPATEVVLRLVLDVGVVVRHRRPGGPVRQAAVLRRVEQGVGEAVAVVRVLGVEVHADRVVGARGISRVLGGGQGVAVVNGEGVQRSGPGVEPLRGAAVQVCAPQAVCAAVQVTQEVVELPTGAVGLQVEDEVISGVETQHGDAAGDAVYYPGLRLRVGQAVDAVNPLAGRAGRAPGGVAAVAGKINLAGAAVHGDQVRAPAVVGIGIGAVQDQLPQREAVEDHALVPILARGEEPGGALVIVQPVQLWPGDGGVLASVPAHGAQA